MRDRNIAWFQMLRMTDNTFVSYLWGIETPYNCTFRKKPLLFVSYLWGIETEMHVFVVNNFRVCILPMRDRNKRVPSSRMKTLYGLYLTYEGSKPWTSRRVARARGGLYLTYEGSKHIFFFIYACVVYIVCILPMRDRNKQLRNQSKRGRKVCILPMRDRNHQNAGWWLNG